MIAFSYLYLKSLKVIHLILISAMTVMATQSIQHRYLFSR